MNIFKINIILDKENSLNKQRIKKNEVNKVNLKTHIQFLRNE